MVAGRLGIYIRTQRMANSVVRFLDFFFNLPYLLAWIKTVQIPELYTRYGVKNIHVKCSLSGSQNGKGSPKGQRKWKNTFFSSNSKPQASPTFKATVPQQQQWQQWLSWYLKFLSNQRNSNQRNCGTKNLRKSLLLFDCCVLLQLDLENRRRKFPGGPMVRIPRFHCQWREFGPLSRRPYKPHSHKNEMRTSLVVQWLRISLAMQGIPIQSRLGKIPHATEQLSPCPTTSGALDLQLLTPRAQSR